MSEKDTEDVNFHFKEITPEDWRANEGPLADLFQRGIISAEYVRQRLHIPETAGQGTMFKGPPPAPLKPPPEAEKLLLRSPGGRTWTVERQLMFRHREPEP